MLDLLYNDDITIKTRTGDDYNGWTSTTSTIKGAIQDKVSQGTSLNGNIIQTSNLLFTNTSLNYTDLIVHNGKDREIVDISPIRNHLIGGIDHYEVRF